jgi:hypothetical protein
VFASQDRLFPFLSRLNSYLLMSRSSTRRAIDVSLASSVTPTANSILVSNVAECEEYDKSGFYRIQMANMNYMNF